MITYLVFREIMHSPVNCLGKYINGSKLYLKLAVPVLRYGAKTYLLGDYNNLLIPQPRKKNGQGDSRPKEVSVKPLRLRENSISS